MEAIENDSVFMKKMLQSGIKTKICVLEGEIVDTKKFLGVSSRNLPLLVYTLDSAPVKNMKPLQTLKSLIHLPLLFSIVN